MDLKEILERYSELEKRYDLPSFERLNSIFDIEKIERGELALARTIRKIMMEKIINSVGFTEMILNPMNAPRMYLVYIKQMTVDDRKIIEEIHSRFADLVLLSLRLEVEYFEKDEAEMIKKIYDVWNSTKPSFIKMIEGMQKPASSATKEKSYFG